jgi:ribosomal-protein-alanine N-acetyltransferase
LHPVTSELQAEILQFERENRSYFARFISDRGDPYFEQFTERHRELLAEQAGGIGAYYVLVDDHEHIAGRFNLYDMNGGRANVGYRVAERFSGFGAATAGVRELCEIASSVHALRTLNAVTSDENIASQKVLIKAGFVAIETTVVVGRTGVRFERALRSP